MKAIFEFACDDKDEQDKMMRMLTTDTAYMLLYTIQKVVIKDFYENFDEEDGLDSIGVLESLVEKIHQEYDKSGIDLDLLP